MEKFFLHGKLTAKPGQGEQLRNILLQSSSLNEMKGCVLYVISKDGSDENSVWVTEVWDSKEDHANSLKLESVQKLIAQAMPILDGMPQKGQELTVLGGKGV